jgi:class 3 adenylate cyclase
MMDGSIAKLKVALKQFAELNPSSIVSYSKGHELLKEGDQGSDFFLVLRGSLSITVRDKASGIDREVALRYDDDLIGETVILERQGRRTATVRVISTTATFVRVTNHDVQQILKKDSEAALAILALRELSAARKLETQKVMSGDIKVETQFMSLMLADIHGFSMLGENTWEENSEAFLFDFIDVSNEIADSFDGGFEDQGDGFKIIFKGEGYVKRAILCGLEICERFRELRSEWAKNGPAFLNIGLGIGICTDCMPIRHRLSSPSQRPRIVSHSMNIAAAMAKERTRDSDVDILIDLNTASLLQSNSVQVGPPEERWLERLRRTQTVHRIEAVPDTEREQWSLNTLSKIAPESPLSVVIATAEPVDESRLRLAQEVRDIKEAVGLSAARDRISIYDLHAVRAKDLIQGLLDYSPNIIHFSGHGTGPQGICLENNAGNTQLVSAAALVSLFKQFSRSLKCVILNACYSEVQADALIKVVDYVIGMTYAVSDTAAISYATGFYQALGASKTIIESHELGCARVLMEIPTCSPDELPILRIASIETMQKIP